jgi:CubicO group peptidase (beta-lactamase class C family)
MKLKEDPVPRMQQVIASYQADKDRPQFMGSILVDQDGETLLDQGYGYANLEWQIPNSPATKVRLGSMTKQFTAASVLLLEDQGKVKTGDPVKTYLPDAPAAWDKITLHHLLTQSSGIPNYTNFAGYLATRCLPSTPEELIARFRDKPLEFQSVELSNYSYSDSNYVLLGYLIEKVSGLSYPDFLRQNILSPLGMKDSGYDFAGLVLPHRASGYQPTSRGFDNTSYVDMSVVYAAGALFSTTHDLLRWGQGLFGGRLLSPPSVEKMTTPLNEQNYACGLIVRNDNGRKVVWHNGGFKGFRTNMTYHPDDKLTVIVLGNVDGSTPGAIAQNLGALARGEKVVLPGERKEIAVSPKILQEYVGTYRLNRTFKITITLDHGQLSAQSIIQYNPANPPKLPIYAESENDFFYKAVNSQIKFFTNERGEVTHIILHKNGVEQMGIKQ